MPALLLWAIVFSDTELSYRKHTLKAFSLSDATFNSRVVVMKSHLTPLSALPPFSPS